MSKGLLATLSLSAAAVMLAGCAGGFGGSSDKDKKIRVMVKAAPEHSGPAVGDTDEGDDLFPGATERFVYYRDLQAYYSIRRATYYWFANGQWHEGPALPEVFDLGEVPFQVSLTLKADEPFTTHSRVFGLYPPRQNIEGVVLEDEKAKALPEGVDAADE